MKLLYIPITSPEKQMDIATQFCHAWDGPIIVEHNDKPVAMMPYDYYREKLSTPEEALEIEQQLSSCEDDTNPWECTV